MHARPQLSSSTHNSTSHAARCRPSPRQTSGGAEETQGAQDGARSLALQSIHLLSERRARAVIGRARAERLCHRQATLHTLTGQVAIRQMLTV